jgi:hypothetical protein
MRVIAVTAHVSAYPNPIRFEPGDRLVLGERDDAYPGWIRVITADGNAGWAPEQFVECRSQTEGRAVEEYTARELNTVAGDSLVSHRELNGWLWVENDRGECGWVPKETTTAP